MSTPEAMRRELNIMAWILQVLLAAIYVWHGLISLNIPEAMATQGGIALWLVRFIGAAELAAAAGLVLPGLTRTLPWLTPVAAGGLMIIMAGAVVYHLRRGEMPGVVFTAALLALVAVVAHLRWRIVPLPGRSDTQTPGSPTA